VQYQQAILDELLFYYNRSGYPYQINSLDALTHNSISWKLFTLAGWDKIVGLVSDPGMIAGSHFLLLCHLHCSDPQRDRLKPYELAILSFPRNTSQFESLRKQASLFFLPLGLIFEIKPIPHNQESGYNLKFTFWWDASDVTDARTISNRLEHGIQVWK
jgi:hypothetical protein